MNAARSFYVGVIGGRRCSRETAALAREAGRRIAEAGWILVCGGGGGVMAAACRGAFEAGGLTVGILPGMSREEANPYLACSLPTGLGEMRNALVVRASSALIAMEGSYGTLSEIALANAAAVPVISLRAPEAAAKMTAGNLRLFSFQTDDPAEAVAWIRKKIIRAG
jgi:uncharacterized protein (TIGR00725 family)